MRSTSVRFADTNVLLYAISRDDREQQKAVRANAILDAGDIAISVQVLQEFYVQATRTSRADRISHLQAVGLIESFRRFPVQEMTVGIVLAALATSQRFGISYWDAAIIEAARSLRCEAILSEDLSHDMDVDGLRVEDPFSDHT